MKTNTDYLNELEEWLEDFSRQDCASEVENWLRALRNLRAAVRPLERNTTVVVQRVEPIEHVIERIIEQREGRRLIAT